MTLAEKELRDCVEYCRQQNGRDSCKNCGLDDSMITALIEAVRKEAWIDGFMATGEGFNGEYCGGHGENDVTREKISKMYDDDQLTQTKQ